MDVGKMRHKIEIQVYSYVENEVGEMTKKWITHKKMWSEKKQLRGSNTETLDKEGIEYTYRFKVRYRDDLNEDMRIVYKGVIYNIKHINPISEPDLYETHIDCVYNKEGTYNE